MKKKKSFTLVEILTVAAIISVLAGMTLAISSSVRNKNREVQTQTTLKMLEMVLEQYKTKHGFYPMINGTPSASIGTPFFSFPADPDESAPGDDALVSLFQDVQYDSGTVVAVKGINIVNDNGRILILDGWKSPIVYVYPGVFNKTKYDLGSAGANKCLGDNKGSLFELNKIPACGNRTGGNYKDYFGKADDITNFKRTDR